METGKEKICSFDQMFRPLLQALTDLGGEATVEDLDRKTIELMEIAPETQEIPHTTTGSDHRSEVCYRLAWARTYLKKYGLLENPRRGIWKLSSTFDGNVNAVDPALIEKEVRQQEWRDFHDTQQELPQMEATQTFENLVFSIFEKRGVSVVPLFSLDGNTVELRFDAVLTNGLSPNDSKQTFIEIKSSLSRLSSETLNHYCSAVTLIAPNECFLLIFGEKLTSDAKESVKQKLSKTAKCEIKIWDYDDLMDYAMQKQDCEELLEPPQVIASKRAIRHSLTDADRKKRNQERIEMLAQEYRQQNVTLFLGAGASAPSGLPTWDELIRRLLMSVLKEELSDVAADPLELGELIVENATRDPLMQVRYINTLSSNKEEYDRVRDILYENKPKLNTELLQAICHLSKPRRQHLGVKAIISYNFDDLLECACQENMIEHTTIYRETDLPSPSTLNIYHVHGYLPQEGEIDPNMTLIFSEEDYHQVYRDAYCWSNLTQLNAFRESTSLFIGCSLTDPNVRRLLDVYKQSCDQPRHFAFLPREMPKRSKRWKNASKTLREQYRQTDDSIRDDYFRSIGVNVIWVDNFDEIPVILNSF